MRYMLWCCGLGFCLCWGGWLQAKPKSRVPTTRGVPKKKAKDLPYPFELGKEAHNAWKQVEYRFYRKQYHPCLKMFRIRISCDWKRDCQNVSILVHIFVNAQGKARIRLVRGSTCKFSSPKVDACLLRFFNNLKFPAALAEKKFQVRLGIGLAC